ncbi:VMO1 protein, partial [Dyaphorophyia castanea]|nr:VMO1 protein [Platysteira castanea]
RLEVTDGPKGTWGDWSPSCPGSWRVCGISTRLEPPQGGDDDTALNDVKLHCCP